MKAFTLSQVNRAHSAPTDFPDDAIRPDQRSGRDLIRHQNARALGENICLQKAPAISILHRSQDSLGLAL